MTDYAAFQYNNKTTYPLTAVTTNSLLQDADPAVFYALDFFSSVLTTYMGARLVAQSALAPAITQITSAVSMVVPFNPDPYLTENQFTFPLLAVYRNKADYEDVTVTWPHEVGEWTVQYILPPLNAGQMERISPILNSVPKILQNRIETKFDPAYASGTDVWVLAGVESIKLISGGIARYEAVGNLVFPCWTGKLLVKERIMPLPDSVLPANGNFGPLTGIDLEEDLNVPSDPPIYPDIVDGKVDF